MTLSPLFHNYALLSGLIAWSIAQMVKVPLEYIQTRRWNWSLLLRAGGMPSSHSALVTGVAHGIGLFVGFDSAAFAIAAALAIVVVYDATGIRRQAGMHAAVINTMIEELASGHPLKGEQLREVLGHTPLESIAGVLLGLLVAQIMWWVVL
jgi:acid phosphatase family membrane protein YuiD